MSLNLLNSFGTKGVSYGLYTKQSDVVDTEYLSKYFVVSEFNSLFTAGKNSISINGSSYLNKNSQILVECLDAGGNNLYIEMAKYSDDGTPGNTYKEASSTVLSIHVYGDTVDGVGKLIIYGTLIDGRSVKWIQNVIINKTLKNDSKVRFYQPPTLEVQSTNVPIISSNVSMGLVNVQTFTGTITGLSVTPSKNTNLSTVNKSNVDIDYRLILLSPTTTNSTLDIDGFNSQMIGNTVTLNISKIQSPTSQKDIPVSITSSYIIKDVINNNTLKIDSPYYYDDGVGNKSITNITHADISINYPYISYNNTTSSYQTTTINGISYIVENCYADITYRNIRTFSGYVARHKIYRKSLLFNADFSIIADEPIHPNQILMDDVTQNKYYDLMGKFYNEQHIQNYWFTSSNNLSFTTNPHYAIDSAYLSSPSPNSLSGNDYIMVKNNSSPLNRNATYIPFNMNEYLSESGSSYDSNFMKLNSNVQYVIDISAVILKDVNQTNAKLDFYFTSSIPAISQEPSYTKNYGIKLAELSGNKTGSMINFDGVYSFYTPQNDLYGTLVVIPSFCTAYIKNISVSVYGDDGFSPDVYNTRIPWPISLANETFEIQSELFDINNNLIYSGLNTYQSFDPSGSTLIPYVPNVSGYQDFSISGSLYVSKSATIQYGDLYIPNIPMRSTSPSAISQSRILSIRADGGLVFDPIVDISYDNKYLYLSYIEYFYHNQKIVSIGIWFFSRKKDLLGCWCKNH